MSIPFFCPSGHRLNAPDSKSGQEIRCPKCQKRAIVPEMDKPLDPEPTAESSSAWKKTLVPPPLPPLDLPVEKPKDPPTEPTTLRKQPRPPTKHNYPIHPKRQACGLKLMPSDAYRIDSGKLQTVQWLALFLVSVAVFSCLPTLQHWNLETAPGWARIALLLAVIQGISILWMLVAPDWATVRVLMLLFGGTSAIYLAATTLIVIAPLDGPLPLGLAAVRHGAAQWCGSVFLANTLAAYLCRRTFTRWRRTFDLETAIRSKSSNRTP